MGPYVTCGIWLIVAWAGPWIPLIKKLCGHRGNWFENAALVLAAYSLVSTPVPEWLAEKVAFPVPVLVGDGIASLFQYIQSIWG